MIRPSDALVFGLLALSATACGYDNDGDDEALIFPEQCGTVQESTIDTNTLLETDLGLGAGAFVEYAEGGRWHIFTTCDTLTSQFSCLWDIIVSPLEQNALFSSTPEDLESGDSLSWQAETVHLVAYTDAGFDGFTVDAEPGGSVRVDALLDGACANRYLFWNGDGARHEGAPSNPMDLVPSSP